MEVLFKKANVEIGSLVAIMYGRSNKKIIFNKYMLKRSSEKFSHSLYYISENLLSKLGLFIGR